MGLSCTFRPLDYSSSAFPWSLMTLFIPNTITPANTGDKTKPKDTFISTSVSASLGSEWDNFSEMLNLWKW